MKWNGESFSANYVITHFDGDVMFVLKKDAEAEIEKARRESYENGTSDVIRRMEEARAKERESILAFARSENLSNGEPGYFGEGWRKSRNLIINFIKSRSGGSQSKPIQKISWEATWEHTDSWVVKKFNELIDAVNELRAKGDKQ